MVLNTSALLLIVSAGLMQGTFVLPMKYTRKWAWENTWLAFCVFGFVVLPLILAMATVGQLSQVLGSSPGHSVLLAWILGFGWGWGSVCFGLGISALGMGLGYSIILGLTGGLGSLIPWFTAPTKTLAYSVLLWCGVLVMLCGVVVCSFAGRVRKQSDGPLRASSPRAFWRGFSLCVTSGVLSCFMNLGFAYGAGVTRRAEALGTSAANAPNALWLVIMSGGFVANAIFCGYLLAKKSSWRQYRIRESRVYVRDAAAMAVLWVGSLVAYGIGANKLGYQGVSIGWPILMSSCIVVSNLWGLLTGEWRGAGVKSFAIMAAGIAILLGAVAILGWASAVV
jgi:L-rhamnose-H+ transport protein